MNQNEYLAKTVSDRSAWSRRLDEERKRSLEVLTELFLEDYQFQTGVRGIGEDGSLREVTDNIEEYTNGLRDQIRNKVAEKLWR